MSLKEELKSIDIEIERLEERRRAIYAESLAAPPEEKVVADDLAEMASEPWGGTLRFPTELSGITWSNDPKRFFLRLRKVDLVKVRPCRPEAQEKTYLGLYVGDMATGVGAALSTRTGVLEITPVNQNPAIWVPDLGVLVFGMESWWAPIKSVADLKSITDADISSVWYVQALRALDGVPE